MHLKFGSQHVKITMKTYLAKRIGYATLTGAALLLSSFGATAASQRAIDVLTARGAAQDGSLPQQAKAQSGVSGVLNPAALSSPGLKLTLADGTTIEARLQRTASDSKKGTQSWIGTFDDAPGSVLVLSKAKGVVTGFANYKDQILEILPPTGGKHVLYAVDESRMPKGECCSRPKMAADATGSDEQPTTGIGATTRDHDQRRAGRAGALHRGRRQRATARRRSRARSSPRSSPRTRRTRTATSASR